MWVCQAHLERSPIVRGFEYNHKTEREFLRGRDAQKILHKTEREEVLSSFGDQLRWLTVCGPIELKFCRYVHNSKI